VTIPCTRSFSRWRACACIPTSTKPSATISSRFYRCYLSWRGRAPSTQCWFPLLAYVSLIPLTPVLKNIVQVIAALCFDSRFRLSVAESADVLTVLKLVLTAPKIEEDSEVLVPYLLKAAALLLSDPQTHHLALKHFGPDTVYVLSCLAPTSAIPYAVLTGAESCDPLAQPVSIPLLADMLSWIKFHQTTVPLLLEDREV
jgi:hypothetical protein